MRIIEFSVRGWLSLHSAPPNCEPLQLD